MDTGDSTDHTRVDRRTVLQAVGGVGLGAGIAPAGADSGASAGDEPEASVADSPGATAGVDQRWAFGEPADGIFSSPTVVDRTVYAASLDGTLYAVASESGTKGWEQQLVYLGTV